MGAYFFFMPRPGFLHLKGSEKVNICGNLLQLPHGFIPSIWFILVYSLSRAGHPRTQDSEDPVSGNSDSTCRRPETLGNSCCCTKAAHGWGKISFHIQQALCHFWE